MGRVFGWGAVFIVVLIVVNLVAWRAGWWFYEQNLNYEYEGNVHSQGYQAGVISQERDLATAIEKDESAVAVSQEATVKAGFRAQLEQSTRRFCTIYSELTAVPADLGAEHERLCFASP